MKNIFKISAVLFIGISLVVSSCKKEEMLIDGCTDISAMNYQDLATNNNGSCEYAYDIAQGVWNVEAACDDLSISIPFVFDTVVPLNEFFPNSIEIMGEGEGVVALDVNGSIVLADVANDGKFDIQKGEKISFDTGLLGVVDVDISGSGNIETAMNGDLILNLTFDFSPLPATTNVPSCDIEFTK
jgi:hypothetical protein